jgi:hypothetical protein
MLPYKLKGTVTALLVVAVAGSVVGMFTHSPSLAGRAEEAKKQATAAEKSAPDHRAGALEKDEPQAVYAADPDDPWNRIFYCLFTRTVRPRLSADFPEGEPFGRIEVRELHVSNRLFERIEGGDRAIDPFYPSHFVRYGQAPFERWVGPRYARLKQALDDALHERADRSPLARALMQADVWAAFDRLFAYEAQRREDGERREEILSLLGRLVRKLALTPEEIKALPDNYAAAKGRHHLPDLFAADGGWLEVRWSPDRLHEEFADYRRVARVFVKPASQPADKPAFLDGLRRAGNVADKLDGVALVTQNLLIDTGGKVTATPLTYEVQVRRFVKGQDGKAARAEVRQYEVRRRLLLGDPESGGFEAVGGTAPAYLAGGGNDFDFASDSHSSDGQQPVLVRLETRCTACHGKDAGAVFTFEFQPPPLERPVAAAPPVALLKTSENAHARHVVERKAGRKDFKVLQEQWKKVGDKPAGR